MQNWLIGALAFLMAGFLTRRKGDNYNWIILVSRAWWVMIAIVMMLLIVPELK
jgi:predicted CDP-diglyceride synthetase/phosphatidate cytidylyltransferase